MKREVETVEKRICLLVLGMHRSGTSAVTRVLNIAGAKLPQNLLGSGKGNEAGHWESDVLFQYHETMLSELGSSWHDWRALDLSQLSLRRQEEIRKEIREIIAAEYGRSPLFVVKDPRICRFAPLFIKALNEADIDVRIALTFRNPLEVCESLEARNGMKHTDAALLWLRHVLDSEMATRKETRTVIFFDQLLSDWRSNVSKLSEQLAFNWPVNIETITEEVDLFLNPALRHYAKTVEELRLLPFLQGCISETWQALLDLEKSPSSSAALRRLDGVRKALDGAASFSNRFSTESRNNNLDHANTLSGGQIQASDLSAHLVEKEYEVVYLRQNLDDKEKEAAELMAALAEREERRRALEETFAREKETLSQTLQEKETALEVEQGKAQGFETELATISQELHQTQENLAFAKKETEDYRNSTSWKLTKPLRAIGKTVRSLKKKPSQIANAARTIKRGIALGGGLVPSVGSVRKIMQREGIEGLKLRYRYVSGKWVSRVSERGLKQTLLSQTSDVQLPPAKIKTLSDEISARFEDVSKTDSEPFQGHKISVLMPVYKVPPKYLCRAIDSVLRQSYQNWELCIVDDGSGSPEINKLLKVYGEANERIKFKLLEKNLGISDASNIALEMSSGAFISLLDHDDMITCDALETIARCLADDPLLDFIYSDECKIDDEDEVCELFYKPDWDPMLLHNTMYTGHFSTYRRKLVQSLGGFRSAFDLSQDYDLALRITEQTQRIAHIPKILYGWRMIPSSAASGGKPEARLTNIAALQDAADRRGYQAKAIALSTANRIVHERDKFTATISIIIPSDNAEHILKSVISIVNQSSYARYEILVVTNSGIINELELWGLGHKQVHFVPFDEPFNFSAKCNAGADASQNDVVIFFNDDVRIISQDWMESILDYVLLDGVGIVGPKLLYENNTIQHAGMVTGVRGLVGTAFHCLPRNITLYFNLAQSVRQVSLICGACLAMKRSTFLEVGGYDADRFGIAHSDVDLCFKVRDAGYDCVYTPYAELYHIGHASIKHTDAKTQYDATYRDKADINALKIWGKYIAYDPYFTPNMSAILYHDSPDYWHIKQPFKQCRLKEDAKDFILAFHDLTNSGAPRALFEIAKLLIAEGHFVVAMSPTDGPYAIKLLEIGAFVIIDELLFSQHDTVKKFCQNFDSIIANTIISWPLVAQCSNVVDCYWYIHETELVLQLTAQYPQIQSAFTNAKEVWATCPRVMEYVSHYRCDARQMEVMVPIELARHSKKERVEVSAPITIKVIGSVEPRKGQDLAVAAFSLLPRKFQTKCRLHFYGRILDKNYLQEVRRRAASLSNVHFHGEISPEQCLKEIVKADIILIPSRDEPFSLVGLDAAAHGRILVLSPSVGLFDYFNDEQGAFLARSSAPEDISRALVEAITQEDKWEQVSSVARQMARHHFSVSAMESRLFEALGMSSTPVA